MQTNILSSLQWILDLIRILIPLAISIYALMVILGIRSFPPKFEGKNGLLSGFLNWISRLIHFILKKLLQALILPFRYIFGYRRETRSGGRWLSWWDRHFFVLSSKNTGYVINLNKKQTISKKQAYTNFLLIAPTGSGKTSLFLISSLLTMCSNEDSEKGSFVIVDLSAEILEASKETLIKNGYSIVTLDLRKPITSSGYDPIHQIQSDADLKVYIDALFSQQKGSDEFFNSSAKTLITWIMRLIINSEELETSTLTLISLIQRLSFDQESLDDYILNVDNEALFDEYRSFISMESKLQSSVLATASATLERFSMSEIQTIMSKDNQLSFDDLRKKPVALFLIVEESRFSLYSMYLSIFFTQLFSSLMQPQYREKNTRSVFIFGDEFSKMYLESIDDILSVNRKYNFSLYLVLQSFQQLEVKYGTAKAQSMMKSGINNYIILKPNDYETASKVERMLGEVSIQKDGKTITKPLMGIQKIRSLKKDQALFISNHHDPVLLTDLKPYYEFKEFKKHKQ